MLKSLVLDSPNSIVSVEYPMHEAAKRGNLDFVCECLKNKVSHFHVLIFTLYKFVDFGQLSR
jgi:hypothetical protein